MSTLSNRQLNNESLVVSSFEPLNDCAPELMHSTSQTDQLNNQLFLDPLSESKVSNRAMNVKAAAKLLSMSERQVQRLLKSGALKGLKVEGPTGPEWRVLDLPPQKIQKTDHKFEQLLARQQDFEAKFNSLAREFHVIVMKTERFESTIASFQSLVESIERLENRIQTFAEQVGRHSVTTKECAEDQKALRHLVTEELHQLRLLIANLEQKNTKQPWWK